MLTQRDTDVFPLHVEIEAVITTVAADPACFHTAEGRQQVSVVFRVDPDHTRVEIARKSIFYKLYDKHSLVGRVNELLTRSA